MLDPYGILPTYAVTYALTLYIFDFSKLLRRYSDSNGGIPGLH